MIKFDIGYQPGYLSQSERQYNVGFRDADGHIYVMLKHPTTLEKAIAYGDKRNWYGSYWEWEGEAGCGVPCDLFLVTRDVPEWESTNEDKGRLFRLGRLVDAQRDAEEADRLRAERENPPWRNEPYIDAEQDEEAR